MIQEATVEVFGIENKNAPASKLHEAQKLMDLRNPKADEIVMSLGVHLNEGIQRILEASKFEHFELDVLKHLLETASFAKKYSDPADLNPLDYVTLMKE